MRLSQDVFAPPLVRSLPRPASAAAPEDPGFIVPMKSVFATRPGLLQAARNAGLAEGAHLVVPSDQATQLLRTPEAKALATTLTKACMREVARHFSPRFGAPLVEAFFLVVGGIQLIKAAEKPDAERGDLLFTVPELGLDVASVVNDLAGGALIHESTLKEVGYLVRFASNSHESRIGNFTLPAEIDGDARELVEPLLKLGSAGLDPRPELSGFTAVPLRPPAK